MPANLENSAVATGLEKISFHSNSKEGNAKECSNYRTIAFISHATKVMLKILQARLQQYVNRELPDIQAGFRKGRGTRDQIADIRWIIEKAREFQKNIYFCFIDCQSLWLCGSQQTVDNSERNGNTRPPDLPPEKSVCRSRSNRTGHETTDWFQIGKGWHQGCILSLCLFNIYAEFSSVQFSRSVMSDSLWPHELQYARPPCTSPTTRVQPNPCPLSRWCHPTISSSIVPFSFCPQSLPASGSFQMSQLFTSGGQSSGVSASTSVLPMNIQDWFPLGLTGWISLQSKGLSRVFSNTTVQKHQFFCAQLSL